MFLIFAAGAVGGCQAAEPSADPDSEAQKVAVYEGGEITQGEVQEQLDLLSQQTGSRTQPGTPQYKQALQQVMPQLETIEMARVYAEENNITVSEQKVDRAVDQQIETIKDQISRQAPANLSRDKAFEQALEQANLTEAELKEDIRAQIPDSLLIQEVQKQVTGDTKPSEQEIKSFYEQNKSRFAQPETRCARHILFNKDQQQKAEGVKKQLQGGADFGKLATKFSQDPGSAKRGGDLGCIGEGETVPEFEDAVFGAETGEIVGPVETDFGYHVIEVTEVREASTPPLSEVEGKIEPQLSDQQKAEEFSKWLEEQKMKRDIRYLSEKYDVSPQGR